MSNYILNEQFDPVLESDVIRWAKWFEHSPNRILRQEEIGDVGCGDEWPFLLGTPNHFRSCGGSRCRRDGTPGKQHAIAFPHEETYLPLETQQPMKGAKP